MTRKYGLLIFGLAKRVKNVIFYSNDVETWVTYSTQGDFYVLSLIPIVKKNSNQFFFWRTGHFVFYHLYSHFKKNLQNLQKFLKILSTLHMCLLLHELTASTSPPHLKHYSLNIKFLWTSFEKHSWSYFFFTI